MLSKRHRNWIGLNAVLNRIEYNIKDRFRFIFNFSYSCCRFLGTETPNSTKCLEKSKSTYSITKTSILRTNNKIHMREHDIIIILTKELIHEIHWTIFFYYYFHLTFTVSSSTFTQIEIQNILDFFFQMKSRIVKNRHLCI